MCTGIGPHARAWRCRHGDFVLHPRRAGLLRDIEKTTRQPIPVLPLPDGIAVEPAEIRVVEPREGQHRQGQPSRHGQHQNGPPRNGQPRRSWASRATGARATAQRPSVVPTGSAR